MHEGRVKPLDTVAREEVKQVYGRETIKLRDPREEIEKILDPDGRAARPARPKWTVEKWGPVGAFLGWTVRPEFWDDQPFILVDYLPLRRRIAGRHARDAAQGDRRQVDHARRREGPPAKAGRRPRADRHDAHRVRPRLEAAGRGPRDDRRARRQAERGAQVAHARASSRRPRSPTRARPHPVHELGRRARRADSGSSTPIPSRPSGSPRSSSGRSRSPAADRPTRPIAATGSQTTGLDPDHAPAVRREVPGLHGRDDQGSAREGERRRPAARCKLDALKAIATYWNVIPREDAHDARPRTRGSTRRTPPGCATTRSGCRSRCS